MVLFEAYFDESGDLDTETGILCISGYVIESGLAKEMEAKWTAVLAQHEIPYFHMVDCAPAPGSGVFEGTPIERRIELVKKLISLIKEHCLHGISLFINRKNFVPTAEESDKDPYTACAELCVITVQALLKDRNAEKVAYFFEAGHSSQGNAYNYLAKYVAKTGASVSFARKGEIHLLEAADLLAWQSAKYLKDLMGRKRSPRKDFLNLMEFPHSFALLTVDKRDLIIQHEEWPSSRNTGEGYIQTKDAKVFFDSKNWDAMLNNPHPFFITSYFLPVWRISANVVAWSASPTFMDL